MMTYEKQIKQEAAKKIAAKLLLKGLDLEFVAENTGIDIDTIKEIKDTIH